MTDTRYRLPFAAARITAVGIAIAFVAGCVSQTAIDTPAPSPAGETDRVRAAQQPIATGSVIERSGSASPSPTTSPASSPERETARLQPFELDLYRRGDFVSQKTIDWCVPAAIATMANVIERGRAKGLPRQATLNRISRSLSSARLVGVGSEPEGWAGTLNRLGYGRYTVAAEPTLREALRTAARAIRLTDRPVGLLVWRGAHAWVMTGFEATADPALTRDFKVTAVRVSDPWYPRAHGAWGRTRRPDARVKVERLREVYLKWRRPHARYAELDRRFVLVLPVDR
jgi:hypothetical protein